MASPRGMDWARTIWEKLRSGTGFVFGFKFGFGFGMRFDPPDGPLLCTWL